MHSSKDFDSGAFWEQRYKVGGNSGEGSYGELAEHKARYLNDFVARKKLQNVIEFGCGDGNQLSLAKYERYNGVDVSSFVVQKNREKFSADKSKTFVALAEYDEARNARQHDLALSLDVIYHLVEDDVFSAYMARLFSAPRCWVVIYSTAFDEMGARHVRHRDFRRWVSVHAPDWKLIEHMENPFPEKSKADFFAYKLVTGVDSSDCGAEQEPSKVRLGCIGSTG